MKIDELIPFIHEADRLKEIERKTSIYGGARPENSAEHSWHLALATLVFQKFAPEGTDINKAMKMALLHDLVEIDAGDVFIYGDLSQQYEKELAALERLAGLLPEPLTTEFKALWIEFEDAASPEARFVKALDRFLPMYSNLLNQGKTWKENGVTLKQVIGKNGPVIQKGIPELWNLLAPLLEAAAQKGHIEN
jgi:putative hydrolase of HD superfamily